MTVIETTLVTGPGEGPSPPRAIRIANWLAKTLNLMGSPDFENRYGDVMKWWVEIDPSGVPQRELGFDGSGASIVAGPFGRNIGFWTDSPMVFEAGEYQAINVDAFELAWSRFRAAHLSMADEDD
jgi:hypothetical protein